MLLPVIKRGLTIGPKTAEPEQQQEQGTGNREQGAGEDERKAREEGKGKKEQVTEEKKPQAEKPAASAQPSTAPVSKEPEKKPQTEKPATPAQPSTTPAPVSTPPVKPVETRDRSIYLIQESAMAQVKVNRKLNVSDTPLKDSIAALLAGPTADERRRGMISLVPEGSSLLSVRVEGTTAVLDFNQEFRYNTRGSEGCAAQIKQIVWTATEFPNVKDVQFLIDGQRVDFLSEGVTIRNPIGR